MIDYTGKRVDYTGKRKERLAQALRDGDMETFTKAIRAANVHHTLPGTVIAQGLDASRGAWVLVDIGAGDPVEITEYDRTFRPLADQIEVIEPEKGES